MKKHTANDITRFLHQHASRVTHAVTLHTRYRPYQKSERGLKRIVELAKTDFRHFRNCLNKELYGPRARRKPLQYQPLILALLEGTKRTTDRRLTLHYHLALGNLPPGMSDSELFAILHRCWVDRAHQRNDTDCQRTCRHRKGAAGWIRYSTKEVREKGNLAAWDFENTQIPYAAFGAG